MVDNVLLLTIDSLRFDTAFDRHLSLPTFESLIERGISFERAFATGPGTTPSFPGIITGTKALTYGGLGPLTDDRPQVARQLRDQEFDTAGFHSNPFLSTHFNYDDGFKTFKDYQNPLMGIATRIFPRGIEINNPKLQRVDNLLNLTNGIKKSYELVRGKPRPYVSADIIVDDAIEWLEGVNGSFFCWTHYMDVHHPCHPPAEFRRRYNVANVSQSQVSELYSAMLQEPASLSSDNVTDLRRLYFAAMEFVDDQIGRIVDYLSETGRFKNTLVVLTSDHGELFGEYGQYGKPERMYDELLHVPLVVANGPDYLTEAIDELVSLLDIPPLIHDALGLTVPDEYEGRIPGKDKPRDYIMAEHEVEGEVIVGARSADWLYEGDEINDEHRLFDLRDGFERVDRDHPDAGTVRNAVLARLDDLDVEAKYLQDDVKSDVEDRLEDLGYL